MSPETATLLAGIEEAGTDILTLAEGLTDDELLGSRLTRSEIRRRLVVIAQGAASLPEPLRARLPEIDWDGWTALAPRLDGDAEALRDGLLLGVQTLVPALLMWLRVHRHDQPELFAPAP